MSAGATFRDALEQEMAGYRPRGPVSAPTPPPPPSYRLPHPLLFARPLLQFGTAAYRPAGISLVAGPFQPTPSPRPPRQLTVRQQRAVDELVLLGAELDGDFTARQLRSAYRALARQYHPDRHPSSSLTEKARLARVFASLNENHRCLLAELVEPGAPTQH
jgi:hypothetical protein